MAITFVWLKSYVAIKNGKRAGIILFAHKYNPFLAEARLDEENNTSNIVKSTKIILKKFFLNEKVSIFIGSP